MTATISATFCRIDNFMLRPDNQATHIFNLMNLWLEALMEGFSLRHVSVDEKVPECFVECMDTAQTAADLA